jgi:hypothetical protein
MAVLARSISVRQPGRLGPVSGRIRRIRLTFHWLQVHGLAASMKDGRFALLKLGFLHRRLLSQEVCPNVQHVFIAGEGSSNAVAKLGATDT